MSNTNAMKQLRGPRPAATRALPAGGAPAAGAGGGVPAGRTPLVKPPDLARRGEIANKIKRTKELGLFIKDCT
jgi:hypothetical protein